MASIGVCNIALSEIRASPITSLLDGTPEADACAIYYDQCLQVLLECHEWGFARVRATLALLDVNDRSGEWLYAYAAPADLAVMGQVIYPADALPPSGVFYPWPYDYPRPPYYLQDFVYDGETIYSNIASAVVEYTSNGIEEARWPAEFGRALALDIASRLAITLRDDRALKGDLIQQYEAAKRRAMANDINRYPHRDAPFADEVAQARL